MTVRDAEAKDAEKLDELLTRLIHDEAQYDSNLNIEYIVTENYRDRIDLEGHKLLLLECNGKIVGYIYGFIYQIPGVMLQPIAILDALYVDEDHRRIGGGSLLISEFKKFAQENGACRIELKVLSKNEKALALYEKLLFKETKKYMAIDLHQ